MTSIINSYYLFYNWPNSYYKRISKLILNPFFENSKKKIKRINVNRINNVN